MGLAALRMKSYLLHEERTPFQLLALCDRSTGRRAFTGPVNGTSVHAIIESSPDDVVQPQSLRTSSVVRVPMSKTERVHSDALHDAVYDSSIQTWCSVPV